MTSDAQQKITQDHLQRDAYVYIRQSTIRQVFENKESTARQYELRQRAISLGWKDEDVYTIDCDLGKSGKDESRGGFKTLLAEVGMGSVGLVLSLECSRLSRNSSDWHRLLEICALSKTLILDEEGIYDPSNFNDRLLLGLKGTISETELHMIRERLMGGMFNKAKRGELRLRLPAGYIYDAHGKIRKDPDKRVQAAIDLFFKTFRRVGSSGATVREFHKMGVDFPQRMFSGPKKDEILFGKLTPSRSMQILRNPRYSGAYAYGIRQKVFRSGEGRSFVTFVEQEKWKSFIKDAFAGYITWDHYVENLERLAENSTAQGVDRRCTPREGPALLQGIAICGICGNRMSVRYHTRRGKRASPDYTCREKTNQKPCQGIPGDGIDKLIGETILSSIAKSKIAISIAVHKELEKKVFEVDRIRGQKVEYAKYEMDRAKQNYKLVDASNRLVADELESDWNQKIIDYRQVQKSYEREKSKDQIVLDDAKKREILTLTTDLPKVWKSSSVEHRDRKRIVRLIINDVTLIKHDRNITIKIRFHGGATEEKEIQRPRSAWIEKKHSPEVIQEIDKLLERHTDAETAKIMNKKGYSSGTGKSFDGRRISKIRRAYKLLALQTRLKHQGFSEIGELCKKFDVNRHKIYRLRNSGELISIRYDDVGRYMYKLANENVFNTTSI